MKILYASHQFFPEYYTGTERYTLDLVQQMQKMGHEVAVLTYAYRHADGMMPSYTAGILQKSYVYAGIPVTAWRHANFGRAESEPRLSFKIKDNSIRNACTRLFEEQEFDILHCTHLMRVAPVIEAAQRKSIRIVVHLTDYWMICPRATLMRPDGTLCHGPAEGANCALYCYESAWRQEMLDRFQMALSTLELADVIISPSQFLIDTFKMAGVDTRRFVHHPHGFDYGKVNFRKNGMLTGDTITFGFLGTLLPHKGVHILIDAFKKIQSNRIRLKIYGGYFGESSYYKELLERSSGDPRVEFCGEYDFEQVGSLLQEIDVVVVPSVWYENAPLTISTAHAFRIPVIATDIGGMAEKLNFNKALTFRLGDSDDLAARIQSIMDKPGILKELSRNITPPPRIEGDAFYLEMLYTNLLSCKPLVV